MRSGKSKDRVKLSLPPKLVEKLVCVSLLFCFVKFSFPVTYLMAYYAETWRSRPPNCITLWRTLLSIGACSPPTPPCTSLTSRMTEGAVASLPARGSPYCL